MNDRKQRIVIHNVNSDFIRTQGVCLRPSDFVLLIIMSSVILPGARGRNGEDNNVSSSCLSVNLRTQTKVWNMMVMKRRVLYLFKIFYLCFIF